MHDPEALLHPRRWVPSSGAVRTGGVASLLGALLPVGWLFAFWDAPLLEDALFWFVPTALQQLEIGPMLAAHGALPAEGVGHGPVPPQWGGGLPDVGHPPLGYGWLAAFLVVSPTLHAVRAA